MKRPRPFPRLRRRALIPLAVLGLPALLWAVVLAVAPTEWARTRIVKRLGAATGRPVALGDLRIGVLGGVRLAHLEIGAPHSARDPWLKLDSARINVNVLHLLLGQIDPTRIEVEGLSLRVRRRADGTLELADLIAPAGAEASASSTDATSESCQCEGPTGLEVHVRGARLMVIDEPSRTRLDFTGVEGHATAEHHRMTIHDLRGMLNGGTFELAASFDRSGTEPSFEGQIRTRGVALDEGMSALSYLVPVLPGAESSVQGRLDLNVYLRGQGATRAGIRRTLVGQGSIGLDPIRLDGSKFLAELAASADLPAEARVGSVRTDFTIKDGRVATENLTLDVARVPVVLAGWTDFDGTLDYRVRSEGVTRRLGGKARNLLAELKIDPEAATALRVQGTLDALKVTLDGVPLGGPGDDRQRLRDLSRQLRDRIWR